MIKKILIARSAWAEIYEPAWLRALRILGYQCEMFETHQYIGSGISGRIQQRLLLGPKIAFVNEELKRRLAEYEPDVCLFYQGHHFKPSTIAEINKKCITAGYHNDNPFSKRKILFRYRHLIPALPYYDIYHVYRNSDIRNFSDAGVDMVRQLMSYYIPWKDYPHKWESEEERKIWDCDIVYAGHAEPDQRIACIKSLIMQGYKIKIYGEHSNWSKYLSNKYLKKIPPIKKVVGDEYRKAICGARVALCFFSKWNEDEYTRRVFEIPACKTALFSESTTTMNSLYLPDSEAVYFKDTSELNKKIKYYLSHQEQIDTIANAGYDRAMNSGYDIFSRMRQWIDDLSKIKVKK